MMNRKEYERKRFKVLSQHSPGGTEGNHENLYLRMGTEIISEL
jgi:hypothetical protein